jgi:FSR family fosmidomycin resistance protein-like MFS transporter
MTVLKNKTLLIVSFGHFATDFFASFMPLVWPLLMVPLGLTYGMIGVAGTIYSVSSSLAQPVFGYLGDRFSSRFLAAAGLAWAATFMGFLGFVDNYALLVINVVLVGVGVAAFHPQGAMNAALASGRQKASGMSIFSLGGTAAFALGPLVGGWLFTTALGLKATALMVLPGIVAAIWLYRIMLGIDQHKEAAAAARSDVPQARIPLASLAALIMVIGLRAWTFSAATTYAPLLFKSWNLPITFSGQVLFLLQAGGALGVLVGGVLADRLGKRRVTALSLLLFAPATLLFFQSPMELAAVAGILFGFVGEISMPITVVIGQELLPRNVGVASGLVMGLAFVTGGFGVAVTGFMADLWGLVPALSVLAILPLLATGLCLALPATGRTEITR